MNDYKVKAEIVVDNSGEEPKIQKILYECDRTQCNVCSERCRSTFDIKHARKYGLFENIDGTNTTVVSPDDSNIMIMSEEEYEKYMAEKLTREQKLRKWKICGDFLRVPAEENNVTEEGDCILFIHAFSHIILLEKLCCIKIILTNKQVSFLKYDSPDETIAAYELLLEDLANVQK